MSEAKSPDAPTVDDVLARVTQLQTSCQNTMTLLSNLADSRIPADEVNAIEASVVGLCEQWRRDLEASRTAVLGSFETQEETVDRVSLEMDDLAWVAARLTKATGFADADVAEEEKKE
jgi:HAMP domain-containing protein